MRSKCSRCRVLTSTGWGWGWQTLVWNRSLVSCLEYKKRQMGKRLFHLFLPLMWPKLWNGVKPQTINQLDASKVIPLPLTLTPPNSLMYANFPTPPILLLHLLLHPSTITHPIPSHTLTLGFTIFTPARSRIRGWRDRVRVGLEMGTGDPHLLWIILILQNKVSTPSVSA